MWSNITNKDKGVNKCQEVLRVLCSFLACKLYSDKTGCTNLIVERRSELNIKVENVEVPENYVKDIK